MTGRFDSRVALITGTAEVEVSVPEGGDAGRFAQVVAAHLHRFGQRDELEVVWS